MADESQRRDPYRSARIGTAAALTAVIVVLLSIDAFSPEYDVNQVTLTALLATVLTLLGIEATSIFGKRK